MFNQRISVQTSSGVTEYSYDPSGLRTSSWKASTDVGNEGRIYWDGQQIAFRDKDGTTYFDHQDYLGTERIRTDYQGATAAQYLSGPFGDGYSTILTNTNSDQDSLHFAGLDQDAEIATEHATFRQYSPAQGSWMSPDPYDGSYDFSNPASFNRYAYVMNSPMSFTDPSSQALCGVSVAAEGGLAVSGPIGWVALGTCIAGTVWDLLDIFGSPSFHGSLQPRPDTNPWDENHIYFGSPNIAGCSKHFIYESMTRCDTCTACVRSKMHRARAFVGAGSVAVSC